VVPRLAGAVRAGVFALETHPGPVAEFHAADLLADLRPRVMVCDAAPSALVLGSRQHLDLVDLAACRAAGIDVVRRRSGGGLVLVEAGAMCWFDVVVPANDPRFVSVAGDVGASMRWLGGHIAAALAEVGVGDTVVHAAAMTGGRWADLVCFAGVGPGEVVRQGRKLVGISQRRTGVGSRFQCMIHLRWSPDVLVSLLAAPRPGVDELPPVAVVAAEVGNALPAAVVGALSTATH
jgi:lipoate---protein ligase